MGGGRVVSKVAERNRSVIGMLTDARRVEKKKVKAMLVEGGN